MLFHEKPEYIDNKVGQVLLSYLIYFIFLYMYVNRNSERFVQDLYSTLYV